ncbi:unnamed protein product, partial [Phaeothamnion confervicola]
MAGFQCTEHLLVKCYRDHAVEHPFPCPQLSHSVFATCDWTLLPSPPLNLLCSLSSSTGRGQRCGGMLWMPLPWRTPPASLMLSSIRAPLMQCCQRTRRNPPSRPPLCWRRPAACCGPAAATSASRCCRTLWPVRCSPNCRCGGLSSTPCPPPPSR